MSKTGAFTRARAFPHNSNVSRPYGDPHFCGICSRMMLPVFGARHAVGRYCPAVPSVVSEDAVGLADHVPAFDVMEVCSIGFAGFYVPSVEFCSKLAEL